MLGWLELWLETEWPELDVRVTSVTDHWATMAIAGPAARALLEPLTDIDLAPDAFRFMDWKAGTVAGVPARVFRISFTGDLSYEINVPAHFGAHVWRALFAESERAGHDLTPYGTETMHVLRAEKGFVIVGQDTDGSMTPHDLDHGWAVAANKPFSFLGKRGMARADCLREGRKQLVGLETTDPDVVLPEGAQAVRDPDRADPDDDGRTRHVELPERRPRSARSRWASSRTASPGRASACTSRSPTGARSRRRSATPSGSIRTT